MAGGLPKKWYEFKDTYLKNFRENMNLKVEAFEPPIFQHTGIYSSVNIRPLDELSFGMEARELSSQGKPIVFNEALWKGLVKKPNLDSAKSSPKSAPTSRRPH